MRPLLCPCSFRTSATKERIDFIGREYGGRQSGLTSSESIFGLGKTNDTATVPEFNNRTIAGVVGAGVYFAWFYLTFFSNVVLFEMPANLSIEPLFRAAGFLAFALALLFALVFNKWMIKYSSRVFNTAIAPFLPLPLYVVYFLQNATTLSLPWIPLALIGWILFGFACLSFALNTSVFLSSLDSKTTPFILTISILLAALIYFVVDLAQKPANTLVMIALPFVLTLCNYFTDAPSIKKKIDLSLEEEVRPLRALRMNSSVIPLQFIFGMVFGFAIAIAINTSIDYTGSWETVGGSIFPSWLSVFLWLPGPFLLIFYLTRHTVDNYQNTFIFLMAIAMCALLFMPLNIPPITIICCCLLVLCFSLFDYLHIQAIASLAQELTGEGLILFCTNRFFVIIGMFVGYLVVACFQISSDYQEPLFPLFIAIVTALYILFITTQAAKNTKKVISIMPEKKLSGKWNSICKQICAEAKLSARQQEVFMMLAKGRNTTYIEKELVISNHTVKAHIYRIYQKLDVHSQQQLIDMIEARISKSAEFKNAK